MKQVVTRCDGITYERTTKENNYNKLITLRISEEQLEGLKKIADFENISVANVIRDLIDDFFEGEK